MPDPFGHMFQRGRDGRCKLIVIHSAIGPEADAMASGTSAVPIATLGTSMAGRENHRGRTSAPTALSDSADCPESEPQQ